MGLSKFPDTLSPVFGDDIGDGNLRVEVSLTAAAAASFPPSPFG
jgi:hypothetical protein